MLAMTAPQQVLELHRHQLFKHPGGSDNSDRDLACGPVDRSDEEATVTMMIVNQIALSSLFQHDEAANPNKQKCCYGEFLKH